MDIDQIFGTYARLF